MRRYDACSLDSDKLLYGYAGNALCHLLSLGDIIVDMQVTVKPCDTIRFVPHPFHDGGKYDSWDDFRTRLDGEGYGGGVRLLKAMGKVFFHECEERAVQLPQRYFELSYETNIPRQAGLSGSSAIACAAFTCLLKYYDIEDRCGMSLPQSSRPAPT